MTTHDFNLLKSGFKPVYGNRIPYYAVLKMDVSPEQYADLKREVFPKEDWDFAGKIYQEVLKEKKLKFGLKS